MKNIYRCKINDIKDRHIAEIHNKLLNNILCYKAYVSKWNKNISNLCMHCKNLEKIKHLILECNNVHEIWIPNSVGKFLSFQNKWKHIVVGFYSEENDKIKTLTLFISYVAYTCRIYKYKIQCRLDFLNETEYNLYNHVKKSIYFYSSVLGQLNEPVTNKIFVDFSKTM